MCGNFQQLQNNMCKVSEWKFRQFFVVVGENDAQNALCV